MSTATKPTADYTNLRAWLQGRKQASAKSAGESSLPSADSTIPPEEGRKSPDTGARFSEHTADVKTVSGRPVEEQAGNAKDIQKLPNTNLEQTTCDEGDSQTRAVKKIEGESEKISGLNLADDAELTKALEALNKAAAALPDLLNRDLPAKAATEQKAATPEWNAEQQAIANTVEMYRKMGSDRGRIAVSFMRGFDDTTAFLKAAADDGSLAAMLQGGGDPAAAGAGGAGPEMPPATPPMPDAAAPAPGGGDPAAGGAGGAGGGAISPDDLAAAFAEAGITPDELLQILQQMKTELGGAGGGAPPAAAPGGDSGGSGGGDDGSGADMPADMKDKAAAAIAYGEKLAHDVKAHQRSGRFSFKPAADGSPNRKSRDAVKAYLAELRAA